MTVVAPLSGVVAALVPVAIGLLQGDRASALALVGIVCAVPAIAPVAGGSEPTRPPPAPRQARGSAPP